MASEQHRHQTSAAATKQQQSGGERPGAATAATTEGQQERGSGRPRAASLFFCSEPEAQPPPVATIPSAAGQQAAATSQQTGRRAAGEPLGSDGQLDASSSQRATAVDSVAGAAVSDSVAVHRIRLSDSISEEATVVCTSALDHGLTLFAVAVRALLLVHCAPAPPPALRPPSASNSVAVRVTRHPASRTPASFVRRHVASTAATTHRARYRVCAAAERRADGEEQSADGRGAATTASGSRSGPTGHASRKTTNARGWNSKPAPQQPRAKAKAAQFVRGAHCLMLAAA